MRGFFIFYRASVSIFFNKVRYFLAKPTRTLSNLHSLLHSYWKRTLNSNAALLVWNNILVQKLQDWEKVYHKWGSVRQCQCMLYNLAFRLACKLFFSCFVFRFNKSIYHGSMETPMHGSWLYYSQVITLEVSRCRYPNNHTSVFLHWLYF